MIRRLLKRLLILIGFSLILFFFLGGKIADRIYNKTDSIDDYEISGEAKSLHQKLSVVDLHADNLLWDRNHTQEQGYGHVDLERLKKGNYTLQVFDAVIKTPKNQNYEANSDNTDNITLLAMANRWPIKSWFNLTERAIHQSDVLHETAQSSSGLTIIKSQSDLSYFKKLRNSNSYLVGGLLSLEGLHALEGKLNNLEVLYDKGYRMMGLVHFFDNEIGGSSAGLEKNGLTDFGQQVVKKMNRMSIIIDLAHASEATINDVLSLSTQPVIVSHTGVDGTYPSPRNLSDAQVKAIASKGGLIGIGFWAEAVGSNHPDDIAKAIRHVADLTSVDHVALGSDFDGGIRPSFDSSQIIYVTEALIREGFTHDEIHQIMGGNALKFFSENLPQ